VRKWYQSIIVFCSNTIVASRFCTDQIKISKIKQKGPENHIFERKITSNHHHVTSQTRDQINCYLIKSNNLTVTVPDLGCPAEIDFIFSPR